ncbi:MAG TPA: GAF domain-containing protein [Gaiellaceae bacterium]|jgi:transcriptional regulator with GAF, ATPase, and Fis domain
MNLRLLDALTNLADELVTELDADACALSRVIGEVLILVAERVPDGGTLQQGQGYLVSDYPQTEEVLLTQEPRALTLDDSVVDEAEARLLRELGFGALLMTALELNGEVWGLVEVYRSSRQSFTEVQIRRAVELSRLA